MVLVHSATKVLSAMTLAVAHSRGWLDYEERVCKYWPEFAQQGKDQITVRQLLAHQAGLPSAPLPDAQSGFTPRAEPETAVCIHVEVGHSHVSKVRDRVKVKRMIRRRHSKRF
jgi:CubicO group peptidase (beta-lactamase class C family)